MTTLQAQLENSRFKIPPPEVIAEIGKRAKQAEEEEQKRKWRRKLLNAFIPPEFENAELSQCLPEVAAWVERIKGGSTRNLILQGSPGVGKSYSASAALLELLKDFRGLFAREVEIVGAIRDTFNGIGSESSIVQTYSSPQILVLDDFGKMQARDWYLPVIWEIIDNRYTYRKPTIFTLQDGSDVLRLRLSTPTDKGYTAASILDRMKDSDVVKIPGKSRRGNRV